MSPWWLKPVQEEHRHSRGRWIALCVFTLATIMNLFSAVLKFSDDKGWFGAGSLAVALLFGLLAAKTLVEIRKIRRGKPPEKIG